MSDDSSVEPPISDRQLIADGEALLGPARRLHAVPDGEAPLGPARRLHAVPDDAAEGPGDAAVVPDDAAEGLCEGWVYEPPDVVGAQRFRDKYRRVAPNLSEAELAYDANLYEHHMPPATRRSYEAVLRPFYLAAARAGFNPLTCDPALLGLHISMLMREGKVGADGNRDPNKPYSAGYFTMFLAAHKCATEARGLPDITGLVDVKKLLRGYSRVRGAELPRCAKSALWPRELVAIERNARESTTVAAATVRVAVTLGCDPDLALGTARLCRLRFADVAFRDDHAVLDTTSEGCPEQVIVMALPGDAACPVAALKGLREARYCAMRADSGSAPTNKQVDAQSLLINGRTGKPLTPPGLKHIVNQACAGVVSSAAVAGGLPQLTPELRRKMIAPTVDTKTARDLMMILHTTFSSARVGEAANFDVGDIRVFGRDHNGRETQIPLVDEVLPDGTVVVGMLGRIAVITETDMLDHTGASVYEPGIVHGVHTWFKHGTKTKEYHDNWYPAQPGHPACPVRILMQGIAAYDRVMVAHHGRRLSVEDPLFTSLKHPGQRFTAHQMSRVLGKVVKAAVAGLGNVPNDYSGHSLRKVRTTHIYSKGASQLNAMMHDGRSALASNLHYVQTDPRYPFAGDPAVDIYGDVVADTPDTAAVASGPAPSSAPQHRTALNAGKPLPTPTCALPAPVGEPASSPAQHETIPAGRTPGPAENTTTAVPLEPAADPPPETPDPETADSPTTALAASDAAADPANTDALSITAFQQSLEKLRSAGFDDSAIAAFLGLRLP